MFVNPFERMKKIREDKMREEKEAEQEKQKYARLGVQMGLTRVDGVVPSFMQTIMQKDDKKNAPPFGMSTDTDYSAPVSRPVTNTVKNNESLKNLSLPGGGGAATSSNEKMITPDINGFITPEKAILDAGINNVPTPSLPNGHATTPLFGANELPNNSGSNANFDTLRLQKTNEPKAPVEQKINEKLSSVKHNPSFFEVDQNAVDQIDALLNMSKSVDVEQGDESDFLEVLNDCENEKQFLAIFGDKNETKEIVESISTQLKSSVVNLEMKKMYSYTTPYLYVIKRIINKLEFISNDDKRALWDRVAIFLSATDYGKKVASIEELFEEELSLVDPIESAKEEFKNAFEAYGMTKASYVFLLRDFRGVEFTEIHKCLLFITELFSGIPNMKFIMELPFDNYVLNYRLSASKSWITLFDIVMNVKSFKEENDDVQDEDLFKEVIPDATQIHESSFEEIAEINDNEILAPIDDIQPSFNNEQMISEDYSFNSEPPLAGGFEPPGGGMSQSNSYMNNSAIKEVSRTEDDDAIRIKIDDILLKDEMEKKEREMFDKQQKNHQLLSAAIDPSVLVDEDQQKESNGSAVNNIFGGFGASSGPQTAINSLGGSAVMQQDNSTVQDNRTYEEVREKLEDFNNSISSNANINIQDNLKFNSNSSKANPSNLKVPNGWDQLK